MMDKRFLRYNFSFQSNSMNIEWENWLGQRELKIFEVN